MNKAKRKKRLKRSLARRKKDRLKTAWRNLFVKSGVLQDEQQ
jgi:hypothetical protein